MHVCSYFHRYDAAKHCSPSLPLPPAPSPTLPPSPSLPLTLYLAPSLALPPSLPPQQHNTHKAATYSANYGKSTWNLAKVKDIVFEQLSKKNSQTAMIDVISYRFNMVFDVVLKWYQYYKLMKDNSLLGTDQYEQIMRLWHWWDSKCTLNITIIIQKHFVQEKPYLCTVQDCPNWF